MKRYAKLAADFCIRRLPLLIWLALYLLFWLTLEPGPSVVLPTHPSSQPLAFSPDGKRLYTQVYAWNGFSPFRLQKWDAMTGKLLGSVDEDADVMCPPEVDFVHNKIVVQFRDPCQVAVYDADSGRKLAETPTDKEASYAYPVWLDDGRIVFAQNTWTTERHWRVWDYRTGEIKRIAMPRRHRAPHPNYVTAKGRLLISVEDVSNGLDYKTVKRKTSSDYAIHAYELESGKLAWSRVVVGEIYNVRSKAGGDRLLVGAECNHAPRKYRRCTYLIDGLTGAIVEPLTGIVVPVQETSDEHFYLADPPRTESLRRFEKISCRDGSTVGAVDWPPDVAHPSLAYAGEWLIVANSIETQNAATLRNRLAALHPNLNYLAEKLRTCVRVARENEKTWSRELTVTGGLKFDHHTQTLAVGCESFQADVTNRGVYLYHLPFGGPTWWHPPLCAAAVLAPFVLLRYLYLGVRRLRRPRAT